MIIQTLWEGQTAFLESLGYSIFHGKKMYDSLLKDTPALEKYSGKFIHRQLIHAFTEYAIDRNCSNLSDINRIEAGNGRGYHFLELKTKHFCMTTSMVRNKNRFPKDAIFRRTRAMRNQFILFPELEPLSDGGLPYLIFIHGLTIHKRQGATREELFCGIGMPNPDSLRQWAEFLSLDEYIKSTPNAPEEKIDEVDMNTLLKIKRRFIDDAV